MLILILLYSVVGLSIFAYRFGQDSEWREDMKENGDVFCQQAFFHFVFWPFILVSLYFWKDQDETGEAGEDSE